MNELERHVDSLFKKYSVNQQVRDMKREILSNLKAKVDDLVSGGMEYTDAVNKAKESITSIDSLIDGNTRVYINKLKLEYMQIFLLNSLLAWVITIPMKIIGMGILANFILMLVCIGLAAAYLTEVLKKDPEHINKEAWINIQSAVKLRKAAWIFSLLFIFSNLLYLTALEFGSNIWFSRPVHLEGPYQYAALAARYLLPALVIFIPLALNSVPKLILRYEVAYYENQK